MADIGHNSGGINASAAKDYARRIATLMDQRKEATDEFNADIKDVFAEAKEKGLDTKALRKAVSLMRLDKDEKDKLGTYVAALDIFS